MGAPLVPPTVTAAVAASKTSEGMLALATVSVALTPMNAPNMNGAYKLSKTPGAPLQEFPD